MPCVCRPSQFRFEAKAAIDAPVRIPKASFPGPLSAASPRPTMDFIAVCSGFARAMVGLTMSGINSELCRRMCELLAILCAPRISVVNRSKRNRNAECLFWSVRDAMKDAMLRSCQHMNRCNVQRYKTVSMTWRHVIS